MKKLCIYFCAGALALGLTACGGKGDGSSGTQGGSSGQESSVQGSSVQNSSDAQGNSEQGDSAGQTGGDGSGAGDVESGAEGWSQEMEGYKTAVTDALGEDYWPNMPLDAEMLEMFFGIAPDLYEDYLAEMPMISTNVDTLVVVKAKEGQADAVEEALNAYRDAKVSDTMQYPMNVGKIQASRVDKIGNYVLFVQLGADTMDAMEISDDAVIKQCQEANELAVGAIRQKLE